MSSTEGVKGILETELWESYRKYSNTHINTIASHLLGKDLSFSQLKEITDLDKNTLNHYLITMRNAHLVKKIGEIYHLTKYGAVLFEAALKAKDLSECLDEKETFKPISFPLSRICMDRLLDKNAVLEGDEGNKMKEAIIQEAKCRDLSLKDTVDLFKDQPDYDFKRYEEKIHEIWDRGSKERVRCPFLKKNCSTYVSPYCRICEIVAKPLPS